MPSNKDFSFCILVGDVELPEYEKDGQVYVESDLFTPYSYQLDTEDIVRGETERQMTPVTPYKIKLTTKDSCLYTRTYSLRIDGQHISNMPLNPGETSVFDGFKDGGERREFLFSLPRFPEDEDDKMDKEFLQDIGRIELTCWNSGWKRSSDSIRRRNNFKQASKKDSFAVTKGDYVMMTTRKGKKLDTPRPAVHNVLLKVPKPDSISKWNWWWFLNVESVLSVTYKMGNSLRDMGFQINPIPFTSEMANGSTSPQTTHAGVLNNAGREVKADVKPDFVNIDPSSTEDSDDDLIVVKMSNPKRRRMMKTPRPEDIILVD